MNLKMTIQVIFNRLGYQIKKINSFDPIYEEEFKEIYKKCSGYHMQSVERLYALYQSVRYIAEQPIEGDIVECGVYKGASLMAASYVLQKLRDTKRRLHLYDTFAGWPDQGTRDSRFHPSHRPTESTQTHWGIKAVISLEAVQQNLWQTGYPKENIIFIKGKVEETLPKNIPNKIALLRLDTDGYESTYHELTHLYPKLSVHGLLIIDDYGHWKGAKDAVDQYFREHGLKPLLHRIDYTRRIAIKTKP